MLHLSSHPQWRGCVATRRSHVRRSGSEDDAVQTTAVEWGYFLPFRAPTPKRPVALSISPSQLKGIRTLSSKPRTRPRLISCAGVGVGSLAESHPHPPEKPQFRQPSLPSPVETRYYLTVSRCRTVGEAGGVNWLSSEANGCWGGAWNSAKLARNNRPSLEDKTQETPTASAVPQVALTAGKTVGPRAAGKSAVIHWTVLEVGLIWPTN